MKTAVTAIKIEPPNIQTVPLTLVGTTPLLCMAWSEEALEAMRAKAEKREVTPRAARNPWHKTLRAAYWISSMPEDLSTVTKEDIASGKYVFGVPARAVKEALVDAVGFGPSVTKTAVRGAVFVQGDLLPLRFGAFRVSEEPVRISGGVRDLRYRPLFEDWSFDAAVEFDASVLTANQLVNLLARAGSHVGIGDWRPAKNGNYGRFVVRAKE